MESAGERTYRGELARTTAQSVSYTNTVTTPKVVEIGVKKIWTGDESEADKAKRPKIGVVLMRSSEDDPGNVQNVDSDDLTSENNWQTAFVKKPYRSENNTLYDYYVEEDSFVKGYEYVSTKTVVGGLKCSVETTGKVTTYTLTDGETTYTKGIETYTAGTELNTYSAVRNVFRDSSNNIVYREIDGVYCDSSGKKVFILNSRGITDPEGNVMFEITNQKVPTYDLSISKTVAGNFGSKARTFLFNIEIQDENGGAFTEMLEAQVTNTNGGSWSTEINFVKPNEETSSSVGRGTIMLSHGDTIVISGLRAGYKVAVIESDYSSEGYTTTAKYTMGDVVNADYQNGTLVTMTAHDLKVDFTNERSGAVPTGVKQGAVPALAAAGIISGWLIYRRRKRSEA